MQAAWANASSTASRVTAIWTATAYDRYPTLTARLARRWGPIRRFLRGPDPDPYGAQFGTRFAGASWTNADLPDWTDSQDGPSDESDGGRS
jgi:hypothetical protein